MRKPHHILGLSAALVFFTATIQIANAQMVYPPITQINNTLFVMSCGVIPPDDLPNTIPELDDLRRQLNTQLIVEEANNAYFHRMYIAKLRELENYKMKNGGFGTPNSYRETVKRLEAEVESIRNKLRNSGMKFDQIYNRLIRVIGKMERLKKCKR